MKFIEPRFPEEARRSFVSFSRSPGKNRGNNGNGVTLSLRLCGTIRIHAYSSVRVFSDPPPGRCANGFVFAESRKVRETKSTGKGDWRDRLNGAGIVRRSDRAMYD